MKTYIYKLKDGAGRYLYGLDKAVNNVELKRKLRKQKDLYYISSQQYDIKQLFKKKMNLEQLLMFTRRLASLVGSGIPIMSTLTILWKQSDDKTLQLVSSHIRNEIESGKKISDAMNDLSQMFPPLYRAMIEVAEKAGGLVLILKSLTKFLENQKATIIRVKKATLYPVIVICFALLVLIGLFVFVVPTFAKVLLKLNMKLPILTKIVITISDIMRNGYFMGAVALFIIGGFIFLRIMRNNEKFGYFIDSVIYKIPYLGNVLYTISLSRFIHSLGILIKAGLPIVDSFRVGRATTTNLRLYTAIEEVGRKVEQGVALHESFAATNKFPIMMVEMIGVGEMSGSIVTTLENLAEHFDQEIEYKQDKMLTMLEPALIVGVGLIVMVTLLAVYLPIFTIWQGLLR